MVGNQDAAGAIAGCWTMTQARCTSQVTAPSRTDYTARAPSRSVMRTEKTWISSLMGHRLPRQVFFRVYARSKECDEELTQVGAQGQKMAPMCRLIVLHKHELGAGSMCGRIVDDHAPSHMLIRDSRHWSSRGHKKTD